MRRIILASIFVCILSTVCSAKDKDMQKVKKNILELADKVSEEMVNQYADAQKPDGSWTDINYQDKNRSIWATAQHAVRLVVMATACSDKESKYYRRKDLSEKIHRGMKFWFDGNFVCPNWWYNQIGVPKILGTLFLLMEDEMSRAEMAAAIQYMQNSKFGMTGQNSAWLAENVLVRAILQKDEKTFLQAREYILKELVVNQDGEGIRPDMSFHQHGFQQQFGNYGLSFAVSQSYWARVFKGSIYALTQTQLDVIHDYLLGGLQWTCWKGYMDVGSCGRQVFQKAQRDKAKSYGTALLHMIAADPARATEYQQAYDFDVAAATENVLTGTRVFQYSDYVLHRTKDWCAGLKMSSFRTIGSEIINTENLLGMYMGDGATFYYRNGNEYEDIFSVWDWTMLPGTTCYKTDSLFPGIIMSKSFKNQHDFAGGISDSREGMAAMILNDQGLTARKSYFFTEQAVVCMGSGIRGDKNYETVTSIEQKIRRGQIIINRENNGQIVYHDGMAYYAFDNSPLTAKSGKASGHWNRIATVYDRQPVEKEIFTLWISHDLANEKSSSYGYMVFPNVTEDNWQTQVKQSNIEPLQNNEKIHAIRNNHTVQAVFFEPFSFRTPNGHEFSAEHPCIVMLKPDNSKWILSICEPTQKEKEIILRLSGKWTGENCHYSEDNKETVITVPVGDAKGKTIRFAIEPQI
jgi:chondroitin AC lyase